MKKIILSGLLALLATSAMAQSVDSEIKNLEPNGKNVKSVQWLGQPYNLTQEDLEKKPTFQTTLSFYKDKTLVNEFKTNQIADFPISNGLTKTTKGVPVGTDIKYAIIPFDDYEEGVLIRASILVVSENKDATTEEQKYNAFEHNKTSLIPLDREVVLNQWGNEELRVLVTKVK